MKRSEMLIVLLKVVNQGFWSSLGWSGRNYHFWPSKHLYKVYSKRTNNKKPVVISALRYRFNRGQIKTEQRPDWSSFRGLPIIRIPPPSRPRDIDVAVVVWNNEHFLNCPLYSAILRTKLHDFLESAVNFKDEPSTFASDTWVMCFRNYLPKNDLVDYKFEHGVSYPLQGGWK